MAADEKALVFDALQDPPTMTDLCQRVTCPEVAAEVYLSAFLAVDCDRTEARLYLGALGHRLGIPQGLIAQMEHGLAQEETRAA